MSDYSDVVYNTQLHNDILTDQINLFYPSAHVRSSLVWCLLFICLSDVLFMCFCSDVNGLSGVMATVSSSGADVLFIRSRHILLTLNFDVLNENTEQNI